jgi:hypothetical protein
LKSELFRSCVQSTQMLLPATASMGSSVPPACRPKPACPWVTRAASHALLLGLRRHRRCPAPNVVCFRDHLDSKWRLLHLSSTLPRQSRLQKHWSHSPPGWRSENRDLPRRRFTCTDQSPECMWAVRWSLPGMVRENPARGRSAVELPTFMRFVTSKNS